MPVMPVMALAVRTRKDASREFDGLPTSKAKKQIRGVLCSARASSKFVDAVHIPVYA